MSHKKKKKSSTQILLEEIHKDFQEKSIQAFVASVESICEKLGWSQEKLRQILQPSTDINLRDLSDIATALGQQLHFTAEKSKVSPPC